MNVMPTKNQMLYQNLVDAKCGKKLTAECMALATEGNNMQMLSLLQVRRKELLEIIHDYQKALDCLDYLVFQIEKQEKML